MKLFENEQLLWESKNKNHLLTTHRIREINKGVFNSSIKSILLEELTYCQMITLKEYRYLRLAVIYFLIINISVYGLNNYLFNSELLKLFFGELHIGASSVLIIFYLSLIISLFLLSYFFFSIKKVFSFYSHSLCINFQMRFIDFEERESFISKVEEAKIKRLTNINNRN